MSIKSITLSLLALLALSACASPGTSGDWHDIGTDGGNIPTGVIGPSAPIS